MKDYLSAFDKTWSDDAPAGEVRFVALDTETTGFDSRRDKLITIGAVAIRDGQIELEDSCELLLRIPHNLASVVVHGITRDATRDGMEESEALEVFLPFLQDGVIVGHHIGHDIQFLNAACERHFGLKLRNRFLDTMDLTLRLKDAGAFQNVPEVFSLDALCDFFGVLPHDRHTAGGDAFLTAQIFLRLLRRAEASGYSSLASLCAPFESGEAQAGM